MNVLSDNNLDENLFLTNTKTPPPTSVRSVCMEQTSLVRMQALNKHKKGMPNEDN